MKVALVMHYLRPGGGAFQLAQLAKQLVNGGNEVEVITYFAPEPGVSQWFQNCRLISSQKPFAEYVTRNSIVGFFVYLVSLINITFWLARKLVQGDYDVINGHEWPANLAIGGVSKFYSVPSVWMCNDVWHLPGNEEREETRVAFLYGNKYLIHPIDRWLTSSIKTIAVLDTRMQKLVQIGYGIRAEVVRSGLDVETYRAYSRTKEAARKRLALPLYGTLFLSLAIFHPHRRFEDIVKAFVRLNTNKQTKLVIAGSDAYDTVYAQKVVKMAQTKDVDKKIIFMIRRVSEQEKMDLLRAADVLVMANEKQTWGLIGVEAMALGTPVIASDQTGLHEVLTPKVDGFVFPTGKIQALRQQMAWVIHHPKNVAAVGRKAKELVFTRLSWENYTQAMEQLFDEAKRL